MDHSEAIKSRVAEKYLLGELTPAVRDQFEEHFFGCAECANDVRIGAAFADNARSVLQQEVALVARKPVQSVNRGWFGWLQPAWGLGFAAALAVLVAVLSYQNLVTIPQLKQAAQPQMLASFSLLTAGSRGASPISIQTPKDRPFGVYVDIPAGQSFPYYTVDIQTESGATPIHVQVSAEQARETVQVLVPAGLLKPGKAELVIEGHASPNGPTTQVAQYPFVVEYR